MFHALLLLCLIPAFCCSRPPHLNGGFFFGFSQSWDGRPIDDDFVRIILNKTENGNLMITAQTKFYNSPRSEPLVANYCPQRKSLPGLWNQEEVELLFANADDQFLQVQLTPHGQHNVLLFTGPRKDALTNLPINTTIDNECFEEARDDCPDWLVTAIIPKEYLPQGVNRFNVHSIHGPELNTDADYADFVFKSLNPVAEGQLPKPDFQYLDAFEEIDLNDIIGLDTSGPKSEIWRAVERGNKNLNLTYPIYYENDCTPVPEGYQASISLRREFIPDKASVLNVRVQVESGDHVNRKDTEDFVLWFTNNQTGHRTQVTIDRSGEYNVELAEGIDERLAEKAQKLRKVNCQQNLTFAANNRWSCDFDLSVNALPEGVNRLQVVQRFQNDDDSFSIFATLCPNGEGSDALFGVDDGCFIDTRSLLFVPPTEDE